MNSSAGVTYGIFLLYIQRSYDISYYCVSIAVVVIFYVNRGLGVNQVRSGPGSWNGSGAWGPGVRPYDNQGKTAKK